MDNVSTANIPRPEYPRPQLVRDKWINLNGEWEFEIDFGKSGKDRRLFEAEKLERVITVPFCPESRLSGIGYTDFMNAVWYRREFTIPESWKGNRVLVHFGAVDYESEVWINGISAGSHQGGYSSFSFDITDKLKEGTNVITVYAEDDPRTGLQPKGKQRSEHHYITAVADYTRTTGIWQTVWLECVPCTYIKALKMIPDVNNSCFHIEARLVGSADRLMLETNAFFENKNVGRAEAFVNGNIVNVTIPLSESHLWGPGEANLYDLEIALKKDNSVVDKVKSYMGLRSVYIKDGAIYINNKPVFQRLVLDQGYNPDGLYTAPSEEYMKRDIEISLGLGFNGARLHEKIFEPRFLYLADKMGYLVWGEHANWGLNITKRQA